MRLLITRIPAEAARLAAVLTAAGHDCTVAPMIEIVPRPGATIDTAGAQGFLITSASGLAGLAAATDRRDLPVYAVGDSTARKARAAGFATVHSAAGDVDDLADLVARTADPGAGRLIHATGGAVAGDLAGVLGRRGFSVERVTLYDSVPATGFAPEVVAALAAGGFDGYLFFSPRTAATFVTLARSCVPGADFGGGTAYCLSAAVAAAASPLGFGRVAVAAAPTEADLVALIAA